MKKFLAILLAAIMLFALAACGGGGETPDTTEPDSTVAAADEVHGIKKDAYATMTTDELIAKLITPVGFAPKLPYTVASIGNT